VLILSKKFRRRRLSSCNRLVSENCISHLIGYRNLLKPGETIFLPHLQSRFSHFNHLRSFRIASRKNFGNRYTNWEWVLLSAWKCPGNMSKHSISLPHPRPVRTITLHHAIPAPNLMPHMPPNQGKPLYPATGKGRE